jgi:DNA repair exonuclease SbcCD nuclease subunit
MKFAITADLHLTSMKEHPERYHALESILDQLLVKKIDLLFIAGDLFDASQKDFSAFENLVGNKRYKGIKLYIIPGNHDADLDEKSVAVSNVTVFSKPSIQAFSQKDVRFLFLPYRSGKTASQQIADLRDQLPDFQWILISHGDWLGNTSVSNSYEPGTYMPLTKKDVTVYKPFEVFLGHIHAHLGQPPVYYMGSPCGIDITETGYRYFIVGDTSSKLIEFCCVNTEVIYIDEKIIIIPSDDEEKYLNKVILSKIANWDLAENDYQKVKIRVKVRGYSSDRSKLKQTIGRSIYKKHISVEEEQIDISEVQASTDITRDFLAEEVRKKLVTLDISKDQDSPDVEEIFSSALDLIYGG